MRGKLPAGRGRKIGKRNIPAYAGKTLSGPYPPGSVQEHPRVCGENYAKLVLGISRNIPAYAGKTIVQISAAGDAEEHPRVCGENT